MEPVTIYGMSGSGNCHKVRLLLDCLERPYEWIEVDLMAGQTREKEFLARNPAGQVPVLELPDGRALPESGAILLWLGEGTDFLPDDAWERAQVHRWLFFEQNVHEPYIAVARFIERFLPSDHPRREDLPRLQKRGEAALAAMERQLTATPFICGERATVADIALYAYTHCAEQGGFDLAPFPAIGAWLERLEKDPGLKPMAT